MLLIGGAELEGGDLLVKGHSTKGSKGFGFLRDPNFFAPKHTLCASLSVVK